MIAAIYVGNFHAADEELSKLLADPAMQAVLAMTVEKFTRSNSRLAGKLFCECVVNFLCAQEQATN